MDLCVVVFVFFFKQKTAYEMRISDWSSDVCSSDLGESKMSLIEYETRDRVALITLNRPEQRNAQNAALLKELDEAFDRAVDDNEEIGRASCRERVCQYG